MPLTAQDQQELITLEHAMWREETRFDLSFQEAMFAADFFEFGRSGRAYTRSQVICTERSPIVATLRNLRIQELDASTALVTYESEAHFGEEVEHARRSSIWTRHNERWQMRFHQGTPFQPQSVGSAESAA